MLSYLMSSLLFVVAAMLEYGVFSRWTILSGSADIVLLFIIAISLQIRAPKFWIFILMFGSVIGFISALPFYLPILLYLAIYLVAQSLSTRVWQSPLLGMLVLTFISTIIQQMLTMMFMFLRTIPFSLTEALTDITLPSLLLNMLLAIPIHALILELVRWLYPQGWEL